MKKRYKKGGAEFAALELLRSTGLDILDAAQVA